MKFVVERERLYEGLQAVAGVVEKRQTSPILANLRVEATGESLGLTATDQEVELTVRLSDLTIDEEGTTTASAKKLMDLCRSLPSGVDLSFELQASRLLLSSGKFRSHLSTLPPEDFPRVEEESEAISLTFPANDLKTMLERTSFAMAQQDVRYFFNGMLFDLGNNQLKLVATNGQRMAICLYGKPISGEGKFIVPRKGVLEMLRLIRDQAGDTNCDVNLRFSHHHIGIDCGKASLISKLIDGEFPNYEDAIPNSGDKILEGDRQEIKDALVRTAILSNEMYRNVKLNLTKGQLGIEANNPLQEDAEEEVQVAYQGPDLAIGFNVSYLIDTLSAMNGEKVRLTLTDGSSAVLLTDPDEKSAIYVISPMVI